MTSKEKTLDLSVRKEALPEVMRSYINELEATDDLSPSRLCRILKESPISADDLSEWADFNHPTSDSYGRKVVYKGMDFEVMVMSWCPGDFSTIHDHGHTQWGAVRIYGPAEHATFRFEDGRLETLARWQVDTGDIIGVGHGLIHQMGNPTHDTFFLSLHTYGTAEEVQDVTGDARLFDLHDGELLRVDGGVFYALPEEEVNRTGEHLDADHPTWFRHMVELTERVQRIEDAGSKFGQTTAADLYIKAFSKEQLPDLKDYAKDIIDEKGHQNHSVRWQILNRELERGAALQRRMEGEDRGADHFYHYAEMYDALIGRPCLDGFMAKYLFYVSERFPLDFADSDIISLGVGTGLVEEFMMKMLDVPYDRIYGMDISEAMVDVARKRVRADVGDVLELDPSIRRWDIAYSGLNVFHYLDHERLYEAIQKTAGILKPGGWFIGDFITPDHIRWYPNLMEADSGDVLSFRTARLIEEDGRIFQESTIINADFMEDRMSLNYAGNHRRFLPPVHRMRAYFEKAFGGRVSLFDAHSLEELGEWADTCPSTRYVIVAQKADDDPS